MHRFILFSFFCKFSNKISKHSLSNILPSSWNFKKLLFIFSCKFGQLIDKICNFIVAGHFHLNRTDFLIHHYSYVNHHSSVDIMFVLFKVQRVFFIRRYCPKFESIIIDFLNCLKPKILRFQYNIVIDLEAIWIRTFTFFIQFNYFI